MLERLAQPIRGAGVVLAAGITIAVDERARRVGARERWDQRVPPGRKQRDHESDLQQAR